MNFKNLKKSTKVILALVVAVFIYVSSFFLVFPITIKIQAVPYFGKLSGYIYKHYQSTYVQGIGEDNYIKVLWNENNIFWCEMIEHCQITEPHKK